MRVLTKIANSCPTTRPTRYCTLGVALSTEGLTDGPYGSALARAVCVVRPRCVKVSAPTLRPLSDATARARPLAPHSQVP